MVISGVEVRNIQKVPPSGKGNARYSFKFEALVNGQWQSYGPMCFGNWSMATEGFGSVGVGWWALDRATKSVAPAPAGKT